MESLAARKDMAMRSAMRDLDQVFGCRPPPSHPDFNDWYLELQRLQTFHLKYYNNLAQATKAPPKLAKALKDSPDQNRDTMTFKNLSWVQNSAGDKKGKKSKTLNKTTGKSSPVKQGIVPLGASDHMQQAKQRQYLTMSREEFKSHRAADRLRKHGSVAKKTDLEKLLKQLAKEAPLFPTYDKDGSIVPVGGRPLGHIDQQVSGLQVQPV
jgi:hypothetical protein